MFMGLFVHSIVLIMALPWPSDPADGGAIENRFQRCTVFAFHDCRHGVKTYFHSQCKRSASVTMKWTWSIKIL
jgi:hypothetical protein